MANHGVGIKFVSVNLNKSYGQQPAHHHHPHHSSSYGSNRTRPGGHGSGGGGGMVVLSRPRSSQKVGPKLSVPPPLNLPSLRKEHERFDSLGSGGGPAGGGVSGSGSRPTSSGMGWTKPGGGAIALQEKEGSGDHGAEGLEQGLHGSSDGVIKGSSVYMPPSARPSTVGPLASTIVYTPVEKAPVLRGEDFPSLHATLPSSSGPAQKQKDGLSQKQKHLVGDESLNEHRDGSHSSSLVDMRPQLQASRQNFSNGTENVVEPNGLGGSRATGQGRKQEEYFPGPLPLVRLNPRSDWADDERDTSHGLMDRGRDHAFPKNEAYWDRDFDMPRISVLPQKSVHNPSERWGQRDDETGKVSSSEVPKVDPYAKEVRTLGREAREGNSWKNSNVTKDGFSTQEVGNDRNGFSARTSSLKTLNREASKENKYNLSVFRENGHDDFRRRDVGYGQGVRQPWHNMDSHGGRGADRNTRERYGSDQHSSRYRSDASHNSFTSKSSYSSSGKGPLPNDSLLNFGREKRSFSKSEKPYIEDPFMKEFGATGFDGRDPFSGGLIGVVKRKKDVLKQTDFHDPVRESFEAELERVQKLQEQERQRIIEEQERASEMARREEEERARLAREQEERQRKMEEEAREAAYKAEQERLDAIQRAEEQRITREKEKQRMIIEEERRIQAAKQKLLELEERIAKRQAEATKTDSSSSAIEDDKIYSTVKEKDVPREAEIGDWEDGERMVERITTSASSDSSSMNRPLEMGSRHHFSRDGSSAYLDRGRPANSWRRDAYENGNSSTLHLQGQDNVHHSPRRDASIGGRAYSRKDLYGGSGLMTSRSYHNKGGISEPHMDDFSHLKGQRWNLSGDGDQYSRNTEIDSEFHDNLDVGWGQGRSRGTPYSLYPERLYPNSEGDGAYSFGRSRYSMRQPRVLPPPTLASMHKTSYRGEIERPGPSAFLENEMQYNHGARTEPLMQTAYDSGHRENLGQPEIIDVQQENAEKGEQELDGNTSLRCDSQSSLSVSSPPTSPTHLSHDDLEESRESSVLSAGGDNRDVPLPGQGNEPVILATHAGKDDRPASSSASIGDDEEWAIENNEELQEQEEYDEDEDGYQEEDEAHEADDENIDLAQEFEDMHLGEKVSSDMMENLVLGFNEGVEVGMPNDEFESSSRNEKSTYAIPPVSSSTVEEQRSFDGIHGEGHIRQPPDGTSQLSIDSSSRMLLETERVMQDLAVQQSNAPQTAVVTKLLDQVDNSSSSSLSSQHPVNLGPHSSSGQTVLSTVPTVPNQTEVPVKLQFGLFSGPSLIPSPVPAIQIGSIQMPLHLHPQVGPSLTHVHPSQPPLFQFGQLRYTSPISQGVLPLGPQSMSFVQPNIPSSFSFNQNPGSSLPIQPGQDSSQNLVKSDVSVDNQANTVTRHFDASHMNASKEVNSLPSMENGESTIRVQQCQSEISCIGDNNSRSESGIHSEDQGCPNLVVKNYSALPIAQESEGQAKTAAELSQPVIRERDLSGPKAQGTLSGGRGKRFVFTVKNSGSRSSIPASESAHLESGGYQRRLRRNVQRTEFRVRESADKRQSSGLVSTDHLGMEEKSNIIGRGVGISGRSGPRKVIVMNKASKQTSETENLSSGPHSSRESDSGTRAEKGVGKEAFTKSRNIPQSGEGKLKRNTCSEEDVDAPLQSGIVRVFEQPGIEAPSDEDDFIEVRSKRQMLNDRREQREKEIKAKSRASKVPRKTRSTSKNTISSANSGKVSASTGGEAVSSIRPDFVSNEGRGLANIELSTGFNTSMVPQPLAPIGTPAVKSDTQSDIRFQTISRSIQTSSHPVASSAVKNLGPGLIFDNKNKGLDKVQSSIGSWGNSRINQQVMALTQTQLDEAMKPGQFDSRSSVGNHTSSISESSMTSSSILTKDKFSSAASPINSLLAGEKIQFGAVTSPTILPHAVSHGIGPPGPCRPDVQISHNLSGAENECGLLFEKEKHNTKSCVHLEDCEAEAEAAASAVAVAAISSDEIVGSTLGPCSVSVSETKGFGGTDIDITAGGAVDQQFTSQSRAEESLNVSLPADLSVETPPISLWPPLPSPENSSSQMLSHFHGGPPSHFPFYEMNPMLGGPVFAFGPHDESASNTQPQTQKSAAPASGPLGSWQQCHSGVDSFYGPPAGFTGPFISAPGGIPGVQGPPHMVVYNHFAPVGQFGQVGLSFMGATYIPSGKQPDWKHNSVSSAMGVGDGEINNLNMVSTQRNPTNMPTPIQHLAPGSPLLPMASPLAMFDVSPFQSSPDMPVQARWPHVPASPLQSVPLSMPLQQQADGALPSKFGHASVDQSLAANRFPESQTSTISDKNRNYPVATDATVTQLPDELGLVDPSSSTGTGVSAQSVVARSSAVNVNADTSKTEMAQNGSSNGSGQSNIKTQFSQHKNNMSGQQYGHSSGYNYQRGGGASQKISSGGEWSHRRSGFQGRNQSLGAEKSFQSSKMKQIYVAKQTSSGTSTGPAKGQGL
ncbi:uncharacterized protein LOC107424795 isoform X1 [Ziziphus jujuba]|uniref:Uncharacterized protein LOC107424795 isoform X1 n=1 Tax=Ziziphus jujuba TaxID=326968 RepID=A0A6P6GD31_ZIZJJ|nr:uncharacterized protein LOC107424795 isoform X1 [Ziziphus jujuba]